MKTNFALGLTQDGITLWQRDGSGWLRVGAVPLDDPDMDTAVAAVVDKARKLSPDGLATKLVIPNEHLLQTTAHAPGPGRDAQETQIRAALVGRTPFPVEELVFDWSGAGTSVAVVVVARETLIEAEDFATAQGLNPVAFVAATAPDGFRGEPFLGLTRAMRAKRVDPAAVVRDGMVLRETGIAQLPTPPAPVVIPDPEPVPAPAPDVPAPPAVTQDTPAPAIEAPAPAVTPAPTAEPTPSSAIPKTEEATPPANAAKSGKDIARAAFDKLAPQPAQTIPVAATSDILSSLGLPDVGAPASAPSTDTADSPASIGFRTRRQGQSATAPQPSAFATTARGTDGAKAKTRTDTSAQTRASAGGLSRLGEQLRTRYSQTNASVASKMGALRASLVRKKGDTDQPSVGKGATATAAAALTAKFAPKGDSAAKRASLLAPLTARLGKSAPEADASPRKPVIDTARLAPAKPTPSPKPVTSTTTKDEAQRMTVFGARGASVDLGKAPVPRQALLITGGVLLVLVAAAIWALYFVAAAPEQADAPASAAPEVSAPAALSDPLDSVTEPTDLAAIEAALGQEDAAQAERVAEDGSDTTLAPESGAQDLVGADAQLGATPSDTPAGSQAAAPQDPAADVVQTPPSDTAAGRVAEIRSNGIVAPQEQSGSLPSPVPPAPFGADPLPPLRGSAEALAAPTDTPSAIATPAETPSAPQSAPSAEESLTIRVTDGSPPSTPPAKPARYSQPETPPPSEAPATPEQQGAIAPDAPVLSESDLEITVTQGAPATVPPPRPQTLAPVNADPPADPVQSTDPAPGPQGSLVPPASDLAATPDLATAALAPPPPGGVSLQGLRPAARPSDLRRVAVPIAEPEPVFPTATAQAVATSVRPESRPAQFAQVVQRALTAATRRQTTPPPATEAVQTASAAVAMPSLPTSTSVAREATVSRAINLRQVNLIGVMGTSSNRRALVRLSNGRVVTVRVGESLDDGQVTAIGDTELRYVRRGRDVVLRIAS